MTTFCFVINIIATLFCSVGLMVLKTSNDWNSFSWSLIFVVANAFLAGYNAAELK